MSGSFVFERDDKNVGQMVFCDFDFTATWFDPVTGTLYCASGENGDIYEWDKLDQPPYTMEWKSARVIADYAASPAGVSQQWGSFGALVTWELAHTPWAGSLPVTFKMWADKQLIFTIALSDDKMFRLPTGYRTDTFEFSVTSNVRVRAVHLSETPLGLKEA
jgi:hypothetical protein